MRSASLTILGLTLLLAFNNCAKEGTSGPSGSSGPSQTLDTNLNNMSSVFSYWNAPTDGLDIDMRTGSFSSIFTGEIDYFLGTVCSCQMKVIGDQDSGSVLISACTYKSGREDQTCDSFPPITYQRTSDSSLQWCGGGSCSIMTH